jgi:tRNA pseudouridine55 synthase
MDGVLLIDKPAGPTSHDVVVRIRRVTGQRMVGHTGTLDPTATGLLPLVLGRATRLASLLTGRDKTYEASIRLGFATDTDDEEGRPVASAGGRLPCDEEVAAALAHFRGTFEQVPPSHSAKKVRGARAYDLARQSRPPTLRAAPVTVRRLELLGQDGDLVRLRITATAGFYVRALARDLGVRLACGAHLASLRRTESGPFAVADALELGVAERLGADLAGRVISPAAALPELAAVSATPAGLQRALHGNALGPEHLDERRVPQFSPLGPVKILAADGRLVALAQPRGGSLHPVVVLG